MDFDRRCQNLTHLQARCLPAEDRDGRLLVVAIAKLTLEVDGLGNCRLAYPPSPIRLADERHGDGPYASTKYPSDYVEEKPGTDVIFVGTAHPPRTSSPPTQMDVELRVGLLHKVVRVFGTRVFGSFTLGRLVPGPPQPLRPTPLRYELAWGGHDESNPNELELDRENPAGVGFAELRHRRVGGVAPALEIPPALLERNQGPAGFGAIGSSWWPRVKLAGTYDDAWRRSRAPIKPKDFDPRFHCCAHPDLWSETPLRGDEPVEVLGATAEGNWRFRLPPFAPTFASVTRGEDEQPLDTHLDTFLIDGDERRVELCWRAAARLPRKAEFLERIVIREAIHLPDSVLAPRAESASAALPFQSEAVP